MRQEENELDKCAFEYLLIKAVDESLSSFGESVKSSVYFHLEVSFGMKRNDIPKNLEDFSQNLNALFRDGSRYIEKLILKRLCKAVGLNFENEDEFRFVLYVDRIKGAFKKRTKSKPKGVVF